jgi:hypothetical protein
MKQHGAQLSKSGQFVHSFPVHAGILRVTDFDLEATLDSGQSFQWRNDGRGGRSGWIEGKPFRLWQLEEGVAFESQGGSASELADYLQTQFDTAAIKKFFYNPIRFWRALLRSLRAFGFCGRIRGSAWQDSFSHPPSKLRISFKSGRRSRDGTAGGENGTARSATRFRDRLRWPGYRRPTCAHARWDFGRSFCWPPPVPSMREGSRWSCFIT